MLKVVIHRTQVISDETRQIADGRCCDLTSPLQFRVIIIKVVHRIVTEWAHYCSSWDRLTHRATFRLKPENAALIESWKVLRYWFQVLPKFLIIFSPLFRCIHVGRGLVVGVWSLKHFWKRCQSNFTIFWKVCWQRSLRVPTKLCEMDKLPQLDSV